MKALILIFLIIIPLYSNAGWFFFFNQSQQPTIQMPTEMNTTGDIGINGTTTCKYADGSSRIIIWNNGNYTTRDIPSSNPTVNFPIFELLMLLAIIAIPLGLCVNNTTPIETASFIEDRQIPNIQQTCDLDSLIATNNISNKNNKNKEVLSIECPDCGNMLYIKNPPKSAFKYKCIHCNRKLEIE